MKLNAKFADLLVEGLIGAAHVLVLVLVLCVWVCVRTCVCVCVCARTRTRYLAAFLSNSCWVLTGRELLSGNTH